MGVAVVGFERGMLVTEFASLIEPAKDLMTGVSECKNDDSVSGSTVNIGQEVVKAAIECSITDNHQQPGLENNRLI